MTTKEMQYACLSQLLYKESFLVEYKRELNELTHSADFMRIVQQISLHVTPDIEFPVNVNDPAHIAFKRKHLYEMSKICRLAERFPAYSSIYNSVTNRGGAGLSAIISIYYAARYYALHINHS